MNTKPNWIIGGLAATALVAVVAGTSLAQSTPTPTSPDTQTDAVTSTDTATGDEADDADEPALNGSITAVEDESLSDEQEAKALAELPGLISESEAIAAATADGGAADVAVLENEDGSVVFEVDVTADDGTIEEVSIDAGNGDVLAREAEDDDDDDVALNSSITAVEDESLSDEQEAKALAELPGLISESEAIAAATADGGAADVAVLENEDGSVVFEVDVTADDGTIEEVSIDAGNGDVLARELDD